MSLFRFLSAVTVVAAAAGMPALLSANEDFKPVTFTEEFLADPDNVARGKEIWNEQCKFCHGKTAYPGKAPKLKPYKYNADFVYKRVTKGFRGMPPWEEVYDENDRMSVTAYIMSPGFSN